MKSCIAISSWWSNCLVLKCLEKLTKHLKDRTIYLLENGKSTGTKKAFSAMLKSYFGKSINEIDYRPDEEAEYFRVIEYITRQALAGEAGIRFLDHDAFLAEDAGPFFEQIDDTIHISEKCLLTTDRPPLTIPAFWLLPAKIPADCPSFAPHPRRTSTASNRPDIAEKESDLTVPEANPLVITQKLPAQRELAANFPLQYFPQHTHLGGLYVLLQSKEDIVEQAGRQPAYLQTRSSREISGCSSLFLIMPEGVGRNRGKVTHRKSAIR